jgi:Na+/melibiose symporter-like transporter
MLSRGGKDVAWYQDATALSYGSIALVIHSMNNLWVTYNFPFFLKILADNDDSAWFMLVPLAYLLWNTVDNPVLGWWSDKSTRRDTGRGHGCSVARVQRIRVGIRWMACMFALSWFPLVDFVHLHFLISLCIYGGSLSYVEVNYTSLLAEISTDRAMRGRCTAWASVFSVCGAVPIVYAR